MAEKDQNANSAKTKTQGVDSKDQASAAKASASKKGLIIGVIALVVVIIVAAVAYNILAPTVATDQIQVQDQSATSQSTNAGASGSQGSLGNSSGSASNASNASNASSGAQSQTSQAPDFTMTAVDGSEVDLSSFEGKPVILNFWASTCGPCKMEMPEFQKAYEQYGNEIQFVMVNVPDFNGETREKALQLMDQSGYTFPVYFDTTAQGQIQYGIRSIPQTYFITASGELEAYAAGAIDASTLERGIDMLL